MDCCSCFAAVGVVDAGLVVTGRRAARRRHAAEVVARPALEAAPAERASQMAHNFAQLVYDVVRIPNPQFAVQGQPGETQLFRWVCEWLAARRIRHQADLSWGILVELIGPGGVNPLPGVLLGAHLDSDRLDLEALSSLRVSGDNLEFDGPPGLDCKAGVAIVLSVLERLRCGLGVDMPPKWQVYALLTVGEESGQKGAMRAPLAALAGRIRYAVAMDRKTTGANAPRDRMGRPLRHAVTEYKGVPLLDPNCGRDLLRHLRAGRARAAPGARASATFPTAVSPNCSDALELRGRWDAEVLGPRLAPGSAALARLLKEYEEVTRSMLQQIATIPAEARVSSMNGPPRSTRYELMQKIHKIVHAQPAGDERFWFSCVNLSFHHDDGQSPCSIPELDFTARQVLGFVESCFRTVELTDTKGDEILFRKEANHTLSLYVNGELSLSSCAVARGNEPSCTLQVTGSAVGGGEGAYSFSTVDDPYVDRRVAGLLGI